MRTVVINQTARNRYEVGVPVCRHQALTPHRSSREKRFDNSTVAGACSPGSGTRSPRSMVAWHNTIGLRQGQRPPDQDVVKGLLLSLIAAQVPWSNSGAPEDGLMGHESGNSGLRRIRQFHMVNACSQLLRHMWCCDLCSGLWAGLVSGNRAQHRVKGVLDMDGLDGRLPRRGPVTRWWRAPISDKDTESSVSKQGLEMEEPDGYTVSPVSYHPACSTFMIGHELGNSKCC
jgi:hypothetical protein